MLAQKFQQYREFSANLKNAALDVIGLLDQLPEFNSTNKYLLKRARVSNNMTDSLIKGERRLKPLLNELIQELDKEIKELDDLFPTIEIPGNDTFHQFQRCALSHQDRQVKILKELYGLGVGFFNAIETQIHLRTQTVEEAHNKFREAVYDMLNNLVEGPSKAGIAERWVDCLEFLVTYLIDDQRIGMPRHQFVDLIEAEQYTFPKVILARYYQVGQGAKFLDQFHKHGFKRSVRVAHDQKKKYIDLTDKERAEVDKIIIESIQMLIFTNGETHLTHQHPRTGENYYWHDPRAENDDLKEDGENPYRKVSLYHIIEDLFKEEKEEESIISDSIKESIAHNLVKFRTYVLEEKCKKFFEFEGGNENSKLGYNEFIIYVSDNNDNGSGIPIKVGDLRNDKWFKNKDNATTILEIDKFLQSACKSKDPQKIPYIKDYLLKLEHNTRLLMDVSNDEDDLNEEKKKIPQREKDKILEDIYQIYSLCNQPDEGGYGSRLVIPSDIRDNIRDMVDKLLVQLFVSKSSFNKDDDYKNDRFILVFNAFKEDSEFGNGEKEYLKFVYENYDSIQSLSESILNKFFFELLEILNIDH